MRRAGMARTLQILHERIESIKIDRRIRLRAYATARMMTPVGAAQVPPSRLLEIPARHTPWGLKSCCESIKKRGFCSR